MSEQKPITKVAVDITPDMHAMYRYTHRLIIEKVPIENGREFFLAMNRYGQDLLARCQEFNEQAEEEAEEAALAITQSMRDQTEGRLDPLIAFANTARSDEPIEGEE